MLKISDHVHIETKEIFICKLCGFSSENESDLQSCIEKGETNNFEKGERVEFRIENKDDSTFIWLTGIIIEVKLSKKTHRPSYMIKMNNDDRKRVFPLWQKQAVIGEFYEESEANYADHVIRKK